MAKANFYHIMLQPKPDASMADIEKKMNLAIDWFRYADHCWIVYTTSNAAKWNERLASLVRPGGSLFVCRLDLSDKQGWISKELWVWLRKARS